MIDSNAGHYHTWLLHTYWRCLRSLYSKGGNSTCEEQNAQTSVCSVGTSLSLQMGNKRRKKELTPPFSLVHACHFICNDTLPLSQSPRPQLVEAGSNILSARSSVNPQPKPTRPRLHQHSVGNADKVSLWTSYTVHQIIRYFPRDGERKSDAANLAISNIYPKRKRVLLSISANICFMKHFKKPSSHKFISEQSR